MKTPNKPFAVVEWNDAHGGGADEFREETIKHGPVVYYTWGWVLRSDEVGVTLAAEWCPEDATYRSTTFIPRGMVTKETRLTTPRARNGSTASKPKRKRSDSGSLPDGSTENIAVTAIGTVKF